MAEKAPKLLYKLSEAAEVLSISLSQVEKLVAKGIIAAHVPPGFERGRMITHRELERYIDQVEGKTA